MGLRPQEFYALTVREFDDLVDGWLWRHRHREEQMAKWVCVILNGAGKLKNKITAAELLGRPLQPLLPTPKG